MAETMFEAPSDENLSKVIVTAENVINGTQPERVHDKKAGTARKSQKRNAG